MRTVVCFVLCLLLFNLRPAAGQQGPPPPPPDALKPQLVELIRMDPRLRLDIRYATSNNFMHRPLYRQARAFLQEPAARALCRVHDRLRQKGYGLVIFDGYRPWRVTRMMWDETPVDKRIFVADPAQGSRHNRGCAVDLSLVNATTGEEVEMPSGYDEFSPRACPNYQGGTAAARGHRDLLRSEMERAGFTVYPQEWWHFDFKGWEKYPCLDIDFDHIPLTLDGKTNE